MRNLSKIIVMTGLVISILGTSTIAMAAESDKKVERINPNAVCEREDVSIEEALHDSSFDLQKAMMQKNSLVELRGTEWNTWGSRIDTSGEGGTRGAIPVGYSEQVKDGVVQNTWHYTRTYLGSILKRGDSDRKWGYETVKATGTFCDYGVWEAHTHIVKYGTID